MADLTAAQKLLVAASDLTDRGLTPFTAELLTVAAWKLFPDQFSMKEFRDFPCTNSTFTLFMGERGLVKRLYLNKVGPKLYTITDVGRAEAKRAGSGDRRWLPTVHLEPDAEARLEALLMSRAVLRCRSGQANTLDARDARAFFAHGNADEIDGLIGEARGLASDAGLPLSNGRVVSRAELDELGRVAAGLAKRFARELEKRKAVVV